MKRILCALCAVCILTWALASCAVVKVKESAETKTAVLSKPVADSTDTETASDGDVTVMSDTLAESATESDTAPATETTTESAVPDTTEAPATSSAADVPAVFPDVPEDGVIGKSSTGMTVEVKNGVTYVGGVLVANKTYALPESYYVGGLTDETYAAFAAMQSAAASEGLSIYCKSGFRSYIDQRIIYWDYVARDGQTLADTYSARPGHSEHQSGMALDINSTATAFADTPEGKWLAEHCWDYGFIIRYPADKVEITGYMYEPWHVRYVGKDIAAEMKDSGLCLEEYLGITSKYAE